MKTNNNYAISDSLWGRITQYASAVKESWGKDVDAYVDDVMETDARSDEELYGSTVLQDSAHNIELVAHLVGSVISNDYTKERLDELGTLISDTDAYKATAKSLDGLKNDIDQVSEAFMQAHPEVQTAFMASKERLDDVIDTVSQKAQAFAKNHPELSHDLASIVEIASTLPAAKAGKIAMHATEEVASIEPLKYLDKAHQHPIEITVPTRKERTIWQRISDDMNKDTPDATAASWMWNKHFSLSGVKDAIENRNLKALELNVGIPAVEKLGKILGQEPEFLQLSTEGKPLGMMLIAKNFKNHVTEDSTGFVWYFQGFEKDYLKKTYNIDKNEFDIQIGEALLDAAKVKSLEAGKGGNTLLHADPSGGDNLLNYYAKRGFTRIDNGDESLNKISKGRKNDGRYFNADANTAQKDIIQYREKIGQSSEIDIRHEPIKLNQTDMALGVAGATVLMQGSEASGDVETQTPATPKARTILTANNTTRADDIIRADSNSQPQSCSLLPPEMRYDNAQIAEFDVDEDENNLTDDELYNEFMDSHGYNIPFPDNNQTQETQADTLTKEQKTLQDLYPHLYQDKSDEDEMDDQNDYGMEM